MGNSGGTSLAINKAVGASANIVGETAGSIRWVLVVSDGIAESGSNAGSNFGISRYSDAGAYIDTPFQIARSTGGMTYTGSMYVTVGITVLDNLAVKASTTSANPILSILDSSGGSRGQFYWNQSAGHVYLANPVALNSIGLISSGDVYASAASGHNFVVPTGIGYQTGGGAWGALSDARIKTVRSEYAAGLNEILRLRPVIYVYKGNDSLEADGRSLQADAAERRTEYVGLVAQEVEPVMPEMVGQREGFVDSQAVDDLRTLNTGPLVFALVNAVKELAGRVKALEGAR
jgi:hypothetical protein